METIIFRIPEKKYTQTIENKWFAQDICTVLASWSTPCYLKWKKLFIPKQGEILTWFVVWNNFLPRPVSEYWDEVCETMKKQFQLEVIWITIQEQIIQVLDFLWCSIENQKTVLNTEHNLSESTVFPEVQFNNIDFLCSEVFPKLFSNNIQIVYIRSKNTISIINKLSLKNEKIDFFQKWVEKNQLLQQFFTIVYQRFNKAIKPEFTCQALIYCLLYVRNVVKVEVDVIWFEKYFTLKMTSLYNNGMQTIQENDLPYPEEKIKTKNKSQNVYRSLPVGIHEADDFISIIAKYWVSDKLSKLIMQLLWLDNDANVGDAVHAYFSIEDSRYYELLRSKQTRIAFGCIRKLFEQYDVQHGVSRKRWVVWR